MRIFLVRHAQTDQNSAGLSQGLTDNALNEVGIAQAKTLANHLSSLGVSQVFSSDLKRAVQTAAYIHEACGCLLHLTPTLRERSLGMLEGITLQQLRHAYDSEVLATGMSMFQVRPGDSESAYDVMDRAKMFFEQHPIDEATAIVTHGMMAETILAYLIGAPPECTRSFSFDNASVTTLERQSIGLWLLTGYNDTSFLN